MKTKHAYCVYVYVSRAVKLCKVKISIVLRGTTLYWRISKRNIPNLFDLYVASGTPLWASSRQSFSNRLF